MWQGEEEEHTGKGTLGLFHAKVGDATGQLSSPATARLEGIQSSGTDPGHSRRILDPPIITNLQH